MPLPRRGAVSLWLVIAVGILAAGAAFTLTDTLANGRRAHAFAAVADVRLAAVEAQLRAHADAVRAVVAYYDAAPELDRQAFRSFAGALLDRRTGLRTLQWAPRVTGSDRATFEAAVRNRGLGSFQLVELDTADRRVPANPRAEYYPIRFVEPHAANTLGLDLAADPARRTAMQQARDTGQVMASDRLLPARHEASAPALLLVAPAYGHGPAPQTIEARRGALAGFAIGVLSLADVLSAAAESAPAPSLPLALYVFDDSTGPAGHPLHVDGATMATASGLESIDRTYVLSDGHQTRRIDFGGRTWTVVARAGSAPRGIGDRWPPWAALTGILILTGLLAGHLRTVRTTTRLHDGLADRHAVELATFDARLQRAAVERMRAENELRQAAAALLDRQSEVAEQGRELAELRARLAAAAPV